MTRKNKRAKKTKDTITIKRLRTRVQGTLRWREGCKVTRAKVVRGAKGPRKSVAPGRETIDGRSEL